MSGERVLGFAKLILDKTRYPVGFKFKMHTVEDINFQLQDAIFLGLLSVNDPPKESVPFAVKKCLSAGIKVIMITGDHPQTAASIGRQVNIITQKTVDEIAKEKNLTWE